MKHTRKKKNSKGKVLLLFLLLGALCFSACAGVDSQSATGSDISPEDTVEHTISVKTPESGKKQISSLVVLNYDSDLFIASKVSSSLNLRDTPSTRGAIIGKLAKNAAGEILEDLGKWWRVRSGGLVGYVASEFCVSGQEARALAPSVAIIMARITAECLNVRTGPGVNYALLTQLGRGDRVPVIEDLDGWYKIRIYTGAGYIAKENAELGWYLAEAVPTGTSAKRQKLIQYAQLFIGIPYKLGGTSLDSGGIDCANFVRLCLKNALGISLDSTSGQLATRGFTVSLSNAKPGDLLFYADKKGKINHVAFYLGDGKIIHAAQSIGQVSISAYNYASVPVLIKNVIGD